MNHAHLYCRTLANLSREASVNALHQALMQLDARERGVENLDDRPAQAEIRRLLAVAGHLGFTDAPQRPPAECAEG
ncbi:MAG: hypothetical protein NTV51_12930 [Verrucomicrobia bacterium]|nr:hypothetical protein [Verrucomicrobiota bacterium]